MLQRFVLYGDGLLVPHTGFGETLLDWMLLASPQANWQASQQGSEEWTVAAALSEASWRVIGKAPHGVVLALGATQIEAGEKAADLLPGLTELTHLLLAKAHAHLHWITLPTGFFVDGPVRREAEAFNEGLRQLCQGEARSTSTAPVTLCDVNVEVEAFLRRHRESSGEKRALHHRANRPTPLGRLLLAQIVAKSWPWPSG
jgi:hypothetical protein